ncbi:hypothetical protein [Terrabacter sp. MAHUQ-38]|uniref:AAA family ATPase n=1 Tax=unclassified Terrabacter TaxID=2630222 RepID=UPI00165E448D|nr:hypothetical protein [Terrabacter sp. MAHUQ-38]MBC9821691.1 hypothetical protein [Terrabacter sp. MAHUQ-38]
MTEVLTALSHHWESAVATVLEEVPGVTVSRRCADVAELLSLADAGVGDTAVVSSDLRGLDLTVVTRLRGNGIRVIGLHPPDDEGAERRLRQLTVTATLAADAGADRWAERLVDTTATPVDELEAALAGPDAPEPAAHAGPQSDAYAVPPVAAEASAHEEAASWRPAGGAQARATTVGDLEIDRSDPRDAEDPHDADDRGDLGATARHMRRPSRAPVIAVWGPTGAPGRTTMATTLAAELASRGTEVLLVDADTYGGCVAQALGLLDEAPGIAAACRAAQQGLLDLPALSRIAPEVVSGLRVLTGLPKAERWPEVRAAALERVLELSRSLVQVVVVDCGFCLEDDEELSYDTVAPRRNEATLTSLGASDLVVAVGGADPVALQRLVRGLQQLGTVPSGAPVPVVNRVRATAVGSRPESRIADSLLRFAGLTSVRFVPDDAAALDGALLAGRSLVEHAPESPVRWAVADLATALVPWSAPVGGRRERRSRRSSRRSSVAAGA